MASVCVMGRRFTVISPSSCSRSSPRSSSLQRDEIAGPPPRERTTGRQAFDLRPMESRTRSITTSSTGVDMLAIPLAPVAT